MTIATKKKKKTGPVSRKEFVALCKRENVSFLDANRKRVYVEYVRDVVERQTSMGMTYDFDAKGNPTAVLVAYKTNDGTLSLGWSAARPASYDEEWRETKRAEKFDKAIGLWKAIRRATGQGRVSNKVRIPDRVVQSANIGDFMDRAAFELNGKY